MRTEKITIDSYKADRIVEDHLAFGWTLRERKDIEKIVTLVFERDDSRFPDSLLQMEKGYRKVQPRFPLGTIVCLVLAAFFACAMLLKMAPAYDGLFLTGAILFGAFTLFLLSTFLFKKLGARKIRKSILKRARKIYVPEELQESAEKEEAPMDETKPAPVPENEPVRELPRKNTVKVPEPLPAPVNEKTKPEAVPVTAVVEETPVPESETTTPENEPVSASLPESPAPESEAPVPEENTPETPAEPGKENPAE